MKLKHFLVVDDNRAFAENVAEILRDDGATVTLAYSGADALTLVAQTRFDALITDMRMPVMSGAVLVHEIRRVDPDLPALVVSAYAGENDLADARSEGVLAVLQKPLPLPQLIKLLRAARRGGLVAVVEDDVQLADNLSEALRARGFTALEARSALEAERLGVVRPFAAIVDLRLPDSPGGEVLGRMAARYPGLPLLVTTGYPEKMRAVPNATLFPKPFDTERLLLELERLYAARPT